MEVDRLFDGVMPSLVDADKTRYYLRVTGIEPPQLIRIEPYFNDDMEIIPHMSFVFIDEDEHGKLIESAVIEQQVSASTHISLRDLYNHRMIVH